MIINRKKIYKDKLINELKMKISPLAGIRIYC